MENKFREKVSIRAASVLFAFFIIGISGCGTGSEVQPSDEEQPGFPKQYVAELYPLLKESQNVRDMVARDGIIYLGIIDSAATPRSMKVAYADMREGAPALTTVPYAVPDDEVVDRIYPNDDGTVSLYVVKYDSPYQEEIIDQFIAVISRDGELKSKKSVADDLRTEEHKYAVSFMTDGAGRTFLTMVTGNLYVWEKDGRIKCETGISGMAPRIVRSPGGEPYLFWSGAAGYELALVNLETGEIGISRSLDITGVIQVMTGISSDFLIATEKSIYGYDLKSTDMTEIVSYEAVGWFERFFGHLAPVGADKLIVVKDNLVDEPLFYVIAEGEWEAEAESEKTVLTFGMAWHYFRPNYASDAMMFSLEDESARIEVKNYGSSMEESGFTEMALDIISGRVPDIILIPRGIPMDSYIRKGVFTDLYPLLDADPTLSRDDLVTSVLKAYETDGKLYCLPVNYNIRTLIAPTSIVGKVNRWTLDEMMAIADSYLPDSKFFLHESKAHALSICLQANTAYLIETAGEGQGLNRELLMKILTFANRFAPANSREWNGADSLEIRMKADRFKDGQLQVFCCDMIGQVRDFEMYEYYWCDEPVSYVGFPSESGNGNLIYSNYNLAISESCEDKEAAWRFIRSLLAEKKQYNHRNNDLSSPFVGIAYYPLLKSAMERKVETETEKYMKLDAATGEMVEVMGHGVYFSCYAPSEEQVRITLDVIENLDTVWSFDATLFDIISEEAGKYFDGGKSLEETVDIIENRLRMYLSERD